MLRRLPFTLVVLLGVAAPPVHAQSPAPPQLPLPLPFPAAPPGEEPPASPPAQPPAPKPSPAPEPDPDPEPGGLPLADGAVTVSTRSRDVWSGRTIGLSGRVGGAARTGRRVEVLADAYPFGAYGRTDRVAGVRADGRFAVRLIVKVNTRYRVRLASDHSAISGPLLVYAYPPIRVNMRYLPPTGRRARMTFKAVRPNFNGDPKQRERTRARPQPVFFYLARKRKGTYVRVGRAKLGRSGGASTVVTVPRFARRGSWSFGCTRTVPVAGMGRGDYKPCGRRTLR
jgi:hypothetical protein